MPTESSPGTRRSKRSSARAAADAREDKATTTEAPTSEVKKQTAAQSLANLFQDNTGGGAGGEGQDVVANLMGAEGGEGVAAEGEAEGGGDDDEEPKAKKVRLEEDIKSSSPPPDVVIGATGVAVAQPKMDEGKPPADDAAHSPVPAPIPMAAVGGAPPVPVPGPLATAISKLPASTPQRAAGAAALAALSTASKPTDIKKEEAAPAAAGGVPAGSVAVPALPPIAEVQQPGGGTVQHDYLLQNLVHASKVSSPLPVPQGRGRAILHGPPPANVGRGYPAVPGGHGVPHYSGMPSLPEQAQVLAPANLPPLPPQKSRKEKSLGVLCQNFMDLFKNAPPNRDNNGTVIEICQVAEHLGVKRRRIYDVINVLESIDIVCRVKKNTYRWHGRDGLPRFFAELQKAGLEERARNQAVAAQAAAVQQAAATGAAPPPPVPPLDGQPTSIVKTKGMAQTCQKLIQIFLVTGRVEIGLSDAAEEVLGPLMPTDETNAQRAMKTKVRRMYDIANVLQAIGIVQKENVGSTSLQNKPSFRWVYHILPCDMSNYLNASPAPAQPLIVSRITSVPSVPPTIPVATRVALPPAVVALPPPQPATVNPEGVAAAVAAAANVELPLDEPEVELSAEAAAAAAAAVGEAVAVDAPVAEDLAPAANSATEQVEI